jgi:hypothetical protein
LRRTIREKRVKLTVIILKIKLFKQSRMISKKEHFDEPKVINIDPSCPAERRASVATDGLRTVGALYQKEI